MPDALWLPDVIGDEFRGDRHVPVTVRDGWKTNGYSGFAPEGVLDHHTGSKPGTRFASLLSYMDDGGYPYGWACNVATASPYAPDVADGTFPIVIVAARRANHAGDGTFPWVRSLGISGSAAMVGIEHYSTYDHDDWHPGHLEVQMRLDACLLEHMGQSWQRRGDHKEWAPTRKVDRHNIDTARWDRDLAALMAARSSGAPAPAPPPPDTPTPTEPEEAIMASIPELRDVIAGLIPNIARQVWERDLSDPVSGRQVAARQLLVNARVAASNSQAVANRALEQAAAARVLSARALAATGTLDADTIDQVAAEAGEEAANSIAKRLTAEDRTA